ncbi:hypothetical protein AM1_1555 [Acaryochloris marina MBIC11017]|uniref:Uncharacterized protein n=1 Tax=Acaryochloris marina (strain MBIC 11017) TaxID=329726 RepID=B0C944_ACAM1|nr:hypothetical protein AM1_1555 [Acaryochloris marina MBIC11017]
MRMQQIKTSLQIAAVCYYPIDSNPYLTHLQQGEIQKS